MSGRNVPKNLHNSVSSGKLAEPDGNGNGASSRAKSNRAIEDRSLIDRCLAGDGKAWDELYDRYHSVVLTVVRALVNRARDSDFVEEIAAQVWYALIKNDAKLLDRFDVERGCQLTTFLSAIAKSEIHQHLRSERRRRKREEIASQVESTGCQLSPEELDVVVAEFSDTLSPREKQFLKSNLTSLRNLRDELGITPENEWQLKHRIQRKLRYFLSNNRDF